MEQKQTMKKKVLKKKKALRKISTELQKTKTLNPNLPEKEVARKGFLKMVTPKTS